MWITSSYKWKETKEEAEQGHFISFSLSCGWALQLLGFNSPFLFSKTLSLTKISDVPLEQDYFVCENLQSKDNSYFCIETPLLVKRTLWLIPINYLLKVPHLLSITIDSLWGVWLVFSYGCYYIRLLKLTYCIRNVPLAKLFEGFFNSLTYSSAKCKVRQTAFVVHSL